MSVEHKEIGGYRFAMVKRKPFDEYLESNDIGRNEWNRLSQSQKEAIVLQYKWHGHSDYANKSAEVARQAMIASYEKLENLSGGDREIYELYKTDERAIMEIRKEFGAVTASDVTKRINVVKSVFQGKGRFSGGRNGN